MGSIEETYGIFRFVDPDLSVSAYDRAIFANPRPKRLEQLKLPLHNFWTSDEVAKGNAGLDTQGFTYIKHASSLTADEVFEGRNVEDVLVPETIDMMLKLTGAKHGVAHNVGFRRKSAAKQENLDFIPMRGNELDQILAKMPKNQLLVNGKDVQSSSEPARQCHVDTTLKGLRTTLRSATTEIAESARNVIEAEDLRASGVDVRVPRFASYSIWRPLQTVKRDPISVCDYRSLDMSELIPTENRIPSGINPEGDYVVEAYTAQPPKRPELQKWYWVPEQKPDEVCIIKFADSAAENDPNIAACGLHVSPVLPGTENEEIRQSSETRVYLFWE
ncbi:hypothetical protein CB0940_04683 [Cercospora beticola]|uniref:GA4 desaturase n=1 Tax=Cercospora beticola TaxID=122368 RepID=A0A2G5HM00_CERBT|nr:hypothetical protein CB0940_04683 [Cercospora beticola]PIA93579.1 hypothetical protein CB0940_04683 [Cercospora beticola]WPB01944.1 hypothetical protein RHO25_006577 [Cercospora beticola]CAK1363211.1 unnamed protein product [Cercospora beticola]